MISEYRFTRRVQFHETDMAGIVHFSNFFRYVEEAEHAMWRGLGLSIAPLDAEIGWPRVAASFEYLKPLKFEDEFEVHLRISAMSKKTISYKATVSSGGKAVAAGSMTIACVSKRPREPLKAIEIPQEIASKFQAPPDES